MRSIAYAELAWPQVAELPRETPLVIPLGLQGFDPGEVGKALKSDSVVVLPAVPYGFPQPDTGLLGDLAFSRALLQRTLLAIQRELAAQGFQRVVYLDSDGVSRLLEDGRLHFLRVPRRAVASSAWPADLARRVVVISTGHTEQHGHHLAIGTDTYIVEAIADGLSGAAAADVVCLPAWPYGASTHTREYPATLNLGGRLFEDLFTALVGRLVERGAQMIFFSNGHGGNHSHLVNVVKSAGERWPQAFIAAEFLHTTGPALERYRQSKRGGLGHGCELETSYMLHLRPDLVDMAKATIETNFIATENYYMDWIEGGRLIANPPWSDDTTSGIYGDATLATAEKGRLWLEAAIAEKLELLDEIREQHARRQAHRRSKPPAAPRRTAPY